MLTIRVNEEYGLTGQHLVNYADIYAEDFNYIEQISDSNPSKKDLVYSYITSSITRYIVSQIPAEELDHVLKSMEFDFEESWQHVGGGAVSETDSAYHTLEVDWQILYYIKAVYVGEGLEHFMYIAPLNQLLAQTMQQMHAYAGIGEVSHSIH